MPWHAVKALGGRGLGWETAGRALQGHARRRGRGRRKGHAAGDGGADLSVGDALHHGLRGTVDFVEGRGGCAFRLRGREVWAQRLRDRGERAGAGCASGDRGGEAGRDRSGGGGCIRGGAGPCDVQRGVPPRLCVWGLEAAG